MSEELKPCPFCGGNAHRWDLDHPDNVTCGGPLYLGHEIYMTDEQWNNRPLEDALQAQLDDYKNRLSIMVNNWEVAEDDIRKHKSHLDIAREGIKNAILERRNSIYSTLNDTLEKIGI
jgi:hypothetical protein